MTILEKKLGYSSKDLLLNWPLDKVQSATALSVIKGSSTGRFVVEERV